MAHRSNAIKTAKLDQKLREYDKACTNNLSQIQRTMTDIYFKEQVPRENEINENLIQQEPTKSHISRNKFLRKTPATKIDSSVKTANVGNSVGCKVIGNEVHPKAKNKKLNVLSPEQRSTKPQTNVFSDTKFPIDVNNDDFDKCNNVRNRSQSAINKGANMASHDKRPMGITKHGKNREDQVNNTYHNLHRSEASKPKAASEVHGFQPRKMDDSYSNLVRSDVFKSRAPRELQKFITEKYLNEFEGVALPNTEKYIPQPIERKDDEENSMESLLTRFTNRCTVKENNSLPTADLDQVQADISYCENDEKNNTIGKKTEENEKEDSGNDLDPILPNGLLWRDNSSFWTNVIINEDIESTCEDGNFPATEIDRPKLPQIPSPSFLSSVLSEPQMNRVTSAAPCRRWSFRKSVTYAQLIPLFRRNTDTKQKTDTTSKSRPKDKVKRDNEKQKHKKVKRKKCHKTKFSTLEINETFYYQLTEEEFSL